MSPEAFGASVGVSGMTMRRIERGEVDPQERTKFLICKAMDLRWHELWGAPDRERSAA